MHAPERLDCRGLYCPEPIVRLQAAVRRSAAGALVEVVADDPGFADDVRLWCKATGHGLLALDTGADGAMTAQVQVKPKTN